jgi:hypothetical protein
MPRVLILISDAARFFDLFLERELIPPAPGLIEEGRAAIDEADGTGAVEDKVRNKLPAILVERAQSTRPSRRRSCGCHAGQRLCCRLVSDDASDFRGQWLCRLDSCSDDLYDDRHADTPHRRPLQQRRIHCLFCARVVAPGPHPAPDVAPAECAPANRTCQPRQHVERMRLDFGLSFVVAKGASGECSSSGLSAVPAAPSR